MVHKELLPEWAHQDDIQFGHLNFILSMTNMNRKMWGNLFLVTYTNPKKEQKEVGRTIAVKSYSSLLP